MPFKFTDEFLRCKTGNAGLVPPMLGADNEFANFILGMIDSLGTGRFASRLLLNAIEGVSAFRPLNQGSPNSTDADVAQSLLGYHIQDWGRKFLSSTGGSAYVDLDHIELPLPEVRSVRQFVAAWHGSIRIVRDAMHRVNRQLSEHLRLQVLANNSDGLGHSYGSHINVLVSREMFNNLFHYRIHHLSYLASYQASSIVFTGQGKVGSENNRPGVDFQIAQRADFIETLCALQTTYRRPLVNSRDEPLCGSRNRAGIDSPAATLARLHIIFYDANLCQVACFLKAGVLQLVLVLMAAKRINHKLLLENPVVDVVRWSHDPSLTYRAATIAGRRLTALELQFEFLNEAETFHEQRGFAGLVPDADEIIRLWRSTLEYLHKRDFDTLFGSIDWITKRNFIQRAMSTRSELTWQSPEIKHLDHCYANIDPNEGLFWTTQDDPRIPQIASEAMIDHFATEPPEDTRAWTRAMLLRLAKPGQIDSVDWDQITFARSDLGSRKLTLDMSNPLAMGREEMGDLFGQDADLADVLNALPLREEASFHNSQYSTTEKQPDSESNDDFCFKGELNDEIS